MGCSASIPAPILTKNSEDLYSLSSSASQSSISSPPLIPKALSLPNPLVHHPPTRKGDTHHLVSLTSTTYGSLLLVDHPNPSLNTHKTGDQTDPEEHSLSPDSVINTWELMDGLDDLDFGSGDSIKLHSSSIIDLPAGISNKPISFRYKAFDEHQKKDLDSSEIIMKNASFSKKKPLWQYLSEESLLSKLDPNVALSYRRALSSKIVPSMGSSPFDFVPSSGQVDRVVVYFTSLRGIRKTYEDCCCVRLILKGFRVPVDERDVSMDSSYRRELQKALGGESVSLPQVFIRAKHIGGVEEIKQLNEVGELAKLLEGFPSKDPGFVCEICGDARFVPCPNCNGSRKVFEEEEGELKRCPCCNENGLIRCPGCC